MLIPKIIFLYVMKWLLYLLVTHLCIYYFCQYSIVSLTTESCFVNEFFVFQFCSLQDPAEADKLLKIQRDLDETKIILVSNCMFSDPQKHKYKARRNLNGIIFMYESIYVGLGKKDIKGKFYTAKVQIMKGQGC
jgi:hypothetical protein